DGLLELLSQTWNERKENDALLAGKTDVIEKLEALLAEPKRKGKAQEILNALQEHRTERKPPAQEKRYFTVVNFEFPQGNEVSLSWYLTGPEQTKIFKAAGWNPQSQTFSPSKESEAVDQAIEALHRWWDNHK